MPLAEVGPVEQALIPWMNLGANAIMGVLLYVIITKLNPQSQVGWQGAFDRMGTQWQGVFDRLGERIERLEQGRRDELKQIIDNHRADVDQLIKENREEMAEKRQEFLDALISQRDGILELLGLAERNKKINQDTNVKVTELHEAARDGNSGVIERKDGRK